MSEFRGESVVIPRHAEPASLGLGSFAEAASCRHRSDGPAVAALAVANVRGGALVVIDLTCGWDGSRSIT